MTPDAWCGIHGYRAAAECPGCPSPGETRRQELAREYEGVPSAQAFLAVCDRLIAAEQDARLTSATMAAVVQLTAEVAALKRDLREIREFVLPNDPDEPHASLMSELRAWDEHSNANILNAGKAQRLESEVAALKRDRDELDAEVVKFRDMSEGQYHALCLIFAEDPDETSFGTLEARIAKLARTQATPVSQEPPTTGADAEVRCRDCERVLAEDLMDGALSGPPSRCERHK